MNPNQPTFHGTYGPYWDEIREEIRDRDNYKCRNCGQTEQSEIEEIGSELPVHHIIARGRFGSDYETANHESNLVTLCARCHPTYNWTRVQEQCNRLGIPRPDVTPTSADISVDEDPIAYWLAEAQNNMPAPPHEFRPIHYHEYTHGRTITGAPTLKEIFHTDRWGDAIRRAGIVEPSPGATSPDDCLSAIKGTSDKLSGSLSQDDYAEHSPYEAPSVETIETLFGDWNYAKFLAGVTDGMDTKELREIANVSSTYTPEDCIQAIQQTADTIEGGITQSIYKGNRGVHAPGLAPIRRHFGSWTAARKAAGVEKMDERWWSDEELTEFLQNVAKDVDGPLTMERYNEICPDGYPSVGPFIDQLGGWIPALRAAVLEHTVPRGYWTAERIIDKLEKANKLTEGTLSQNDYSQLDGNFPSVPTIQNVFGDWSSGLREAGLESNPVDIDKYTDEEYLGAIRTVAEECPHSYLTTSWYNAHRADDMPAMGTIGQAFGNWGEALEEAGLDTENSANNRVKREIDLDSIVQKAPPNAPYTEQECVDALQEFTQQAGRPPTRPEYEQTIFRPTSTTIARVVGGWTEAKEQAGLQTQDVTEDRAVAAVKEANEFIEGEPTQPAYMEYRREENPSLPSLSATMKAFGNSWNAAKEAAGIAVYNRASYSKEEAEEAVLYVAEKLGRAPHRDEYNEHRRPSDPISTAVTPYWDDSWTATLEALDLEITPSQRSSYSKDECIEALKRAAEGLDKSPTFKEYREFVGETGPTQTVLDSLFGGFNAAKQEAGLKVGKRQKIPLSEYQEALDRVVEKLGKQPTQPEYQENKNDSDPSVSALTKRLGNGSWGGVKETIDLSDEPKESLTVTQTSLNDFTGTS